MVVWKCIVVVMELRLYSGGMGVRPYSGGMGVRPYSGGMGVRPYSGGMGVRLHSYMPTKDTDVDIILGVFLGSAEVGA